MNQSSHKLTQVFYLDDKELTYTQDIGGIVMKKLGIVTAVAAGALTTYGVLKVFGVTDKIRLTILDKAIDCYDKRAQEISKKRIIVTKQELM